MDRELNSCLRLLGPDAPPEAKIAGLLRVAKLLTHGSSKDNNNFSHVLPKIFEATDIDYIRKLLKSNKDCSVEHRLVAINFLAAFAHIPRLASSPGMLHCLPALISLLDLCSYDDDDDDSSRIVVFNAAADLIAALASQHLVASAILLLPETAALVVAHSHCLPSTHLQQAGATRIPPLLAMLVQNAGDECEPAVFVAALSTLITDLNCKQPLPSPDWISLAARCCVCLSPECCPSPLDLAPVALCVLTAKAVLPSLTRSVLCLFCALLAVRKPGSSTRLVTSLPPDTWHLLLTAASVEIQLLLHLPIVDADPNVNKGRGSGKGDEVEEDKHNQDPDAILTVTICCELLNLLLDMLDSIDIAPERALALRPTLGRVLEATTRQGLAECAKGKEEAPATVAMLRLSANLLCLCDGSEEAAAAVQLGFL